MRPDEPHAGGQPAQVRQRAPRHAAVGRGQDGVGHRAIQRVALGVARREGVGVARQRAALPGGALPGDVGVDVEQHRDVAAQRGAGALGEHRAAAERDHVAGARALEHLDAQRLLARAEGRLALAVEGLLDAVAELLLEQLVGVQRPRAENGGDVARGRRLARGHEADEDDGPPAQRVTYSARERSSRDGPTESIHPRQSIRSA